MYQRLSYIDIELRGSSPLTTLDDDEQVPASATQAPTSGVVASAAEREITSPSNGGFQEAEHEKVAGAAKRDIEHEKEAGAAERDIEHKKVAGAAERDLDLEPSRAGAVERDREHKKVAGATRREITSPSNTGGVQEAEQNRSVSSSPNASVQEAECKSPPNQNKLLERAQEVVAQLDIATGFRSQDSRMQRESTAFPPLGSNIDAENRGMYSAWKATRSREPNEPPRVGHPSSHATPIPSKVGPTGNLLPRMISVSPMPTTQENPAVDTHQDNFECESLKELNEMADAKSIPLLKITDEGDQSSGALVESGPTKRKRLNDHDGRTDAEGSREAPSKQKKGRKKPIVSKKKDEKFEGQGNEPGPGGHDGEQAEDERPKKKRKASTTIKAPQEDSEDSENDDEERKDKNEPKGETERMRDERRASLPKFIEKAKNQIRQWRLAPDGDGIPLETRKLMRKVADYAPECASVCPAMTWHILSTGPGNTRCLKHAAARPKLVPLTEEEEEEKKKVKEPPFEDRLLSCGCHARNAMWEFYLFKTGQITVAENGEEIIVGWKYLRMDLRMRDLVFEQVAAETCWDLDDIWRYKANAAGKFTVQRSRIERTQAHINRLTRKLEDLKKEKAEEEAEKYVAGPAGVEGPLDAGYRSSSQLSSA
ncbi:hypothetical protein BDP27DRAFT_1429638 [Rhodocollybia butyracea]|uniref:Uncharacterized protein n=1 Tax=Rhodocollybia butyracea TaxID=206335 RepID=A0A9P5P8E2_9AGAR|nr:hypothetical protein BDP27DRAFT_1429638 [Rhodocollybia butyracea]